MLDAGHNDLGLVSIDNMSQPRRYKTATGTCLKNAIDEGKKGVSQREVCKLYNMTRTTLQNKLKGAHNLNPGRQTVLSAKQEKSIVDYVICVANWGFPLDSLGELYYIDR